MFVKEDNFQEDIPSKRIELLVQVINSRVLRLDNYIKSTPKEIIEFYSIPVSKIFSLADEGPIILTLDTGLVVGFGEQPSWASLTLWLEQTPNSKTNNNSVIGDPEYYPLSVTDPIYSETTLAQIIGLQIIAIKILKGQPPRPTYFGLPLEIGLVFEFENGFSLVIGHLLDSELKDLAVLRLEDISTEYWGQLEQIPV